MTPASSDHAPTPALQGTEEFYFEFSCGQHGQVSVQLAAPGDNTLLTACCQQAATACLPALAAWEQQGPWTVTIRLGDATEGQRLNADFRQKDYVPNVLSFPNDDAALDGEAWYAGDVFISLPVVVAEAAAQGKSLAAHVTHLVVHGLLHLAGHDHLAEQDATAMERLETEILAGIGIADPYADKA